MGDEKLTAEEYARLTEAAARASYLNGGGSAVAQLGDEPTQWETAEAMRLTGGGFVSQLGELFHKADGENRRRIAAAWPEYWAKYAKLARNEREAGRPFDGSRTR